MAHDFRKDDLPMDWISQASAHDPGRLAFTQKMEGDAFQEMIHVMYCPELPVDDLGEDAVRMGDSDL
ncbi:hypothetical protein [Acanthopleuribacter pedis]|uniref:Uncharacterized protein n=1 Tax=Acanthopleuribacter pedis TaxID=442870 RepID=A0A8J7U4H4_9BACT|nr:hypothetical protein [Acanthopleuribacter pedis]MBO1318291.1 hypothetical protein [Acanthopleuribacter pedis]